MVGAAAPAGASADPIGAAKPKPWAARPILVVGYWSAFELVLELASRWCYTCLALVRH